MNCNGKMTIRTGHSARLSGGIAVFILLAVLLGSVRSAYGAAETFSGAEILMDSDFPMEPHGKGNGEKFRLAFVDYDEYLPSGRQFIYILLGLEERGWIREGSLPLKIEEVEKNEMTQNEIYDALEAADLGPYLEFAEDAFYYLAYEGNESVAEELTRRAGDDIDLVITFGTSAGLFVKNLGLPVPMVDYMATDPVASGIIDSAEEGSGNPNVWAQVEPSLPLRQLKYYWSICPFDKLGIIVYGDETISGVPDIEASSREIGFDLVKYNIPEQARETGEDLRNYYALVEEKIGEMSEEGIDAFFLTVDLINDPNRLYPMLSAFYDRKIPVYVMDDVESIRRGGLMLISANDSVNTGRFVADTIAKILNGAEAGSLPCIYTSAPSIYFNYAVARRIDYPVSFAFLAACDRIFSEVE